MVVDRGSSEQTPAEELVALGAQLKQAREARCLSLAEISGKTKIQPRFLEAIEAGNLEALPAPVYTQGFLQRFTQALEIEAPDLRPDRWGTDVGAQQHVDGKVQPVQRLPLLVMVLSSLILVTTGIMGFVYLKGHWTSPHQFPRPLKAP